jgi:hypothetical protein
VPDNSRNGWIIPVRAQPCEQYDAEKDHLNVESEAYQQNPQNEKLVHRATDINI